MVDVSYGGENGFNQAIELAAESLQNVKFIQEKKLIGRYFDEISQVNLKYIFLYCMYIIFHYVIINFFKYRTQGNTVSVLRIH